MSIIHKRGTEVSQEAIIGAAVGGGVGLLLLVLILVMTIRKHLHRKRSRPRSGTLQEFMNPRHSRTLDRDMENDYQSSSVTPLLHTNFQNLQHNESTSTSGSLPSPWNPVTIDASEGSAQGPKLSPSLPHALKPTYITKQVSLVSEHASVGSPSAIDTCANSLQSKPSASTLPPSASSSASIYSQSSWKNGHNAVPVSQLSTIPIYYNAPSQRYEMLVSQQPSQSDDIASHDHTSSTLPLSLHPHKHRTLGQLAMPPVPENIEPRSSPSLTNPYDNMMESPTLTNPHSHE